MKDTIVTQDERMLVTKDSSVNLEGDKEDRKSMLLAW